MKEDYWDEDYLEQDDEEEVEREKFTIFSVSPDTIDPANDQELVHTSGLVTTNDTVTDKNFEISSENTICLRRWVEMYQWTETINYETVPLADGREERKKSYSYDKSWLHYCVVSSSFHTEKGHENPQSWVSKNLWIKWHWSRNVTLGAFKLQALTLELNSWEPLPVSHPIVLDGQYPLLNLDGGYYYGDNPSDPKIGDIRVRFDVLKPTEISVIARQTGNTLAFEGSHGAFLFRLDYGSKSLREMAEAMNAEHIVVFDDPDCRQEP